jgi:MFS family permease
MTTTQSDAAGAAASPPNAVSEAPALSVRQRAALVPMVLICAAVFLTALDQTVVVTALDPIAVSFGNIDVAKDLSALAWVVSGYLLGYVIVMPLMGRVSDLLGRQRVLIGCLALFAFGSFLCAESIALGNALPLNFLSAIGVNSPSQALTWLVIARFLQAVGGGAVVPVAIAAIGDLFGAQRRILALGIIGGVTEAGGALGPLYGALILQHWALLPPGYTNPWQWIFLLNLPIVLLLVGALLLVWPRALRGRATTAVGRIDWLGALLLGGALLCTSLGLSQSAGVLTNLKQAQAAQNNPLLLLAALVLLAGFVLVEARGRDPVVDLRIFRSGAFTAGALFNLLLGMGLIIALVDIPIYVLTINGTYLDAGLALLRMTIMIPIGAFSGGWLVARYGTRAVGIAGALLASVGFFLMRFWDVHPNWTLITISTVIAGAGFGLIVAPISTTALNTAGNARFGMAAAIVTALRMIGMILGLAALSSWGVDQYLTLIVQAQNNLPPGLSISQQAAILAQRLAEIPVEITRDFFTVGAALALVAVIPALFLWKPKSGEEEAKGHVVVGM